MDKIDIKLITLLQENARYPLKFLASQVFLSAPAVSSRINKLEKQGIILGYNTIIDKQKLGYHITAFINLEMTPNQKAEFYPFIHSCPNVLECNCVTGSFSMLIKVAFPYTRIRYIYRETSALWKYIDTNCFFNTCSKQRN